MRYGIALLVASLIIGGAGLYVRLTFHAVETRVRQAFRERQQLGDLPPELRNVDPETVEIQAFNIKLPPDLEVRFAVARLFASRWYIWTALVVLACLSVPFLIGRWRARG